MMSLALVYSVTLLGPWGTIKAWANISEVGNWGGFLAYAGAIWFTSLGGMPALWALGAWLGKRLSGTETVSAKELFLKYAYLLVPLGIFAWIAFSIPLIAVNGSYIISTLSDPMGWGWNLFGTADFPWTPFFPEYILYVQIPLLLAGLGYCLKLGFRIARTVYPDSTQAVRSLIPVGILCTGITILFVFLFAG